MRTWLGLLGLLAFGLAMVPLGMLQFGLDRSAWASSRSASSHPGPLLAVARLARGTTGE